LLQLLHRLTDLAGRLSPGDAVLLRSGTARTPDDTAARRASWQAKVTGQLTGALQLDRLAEILLLPSGTDGLLLCSILLSLEAGRQPITAILPAAAAETGSGVPQEGEREHGAYSC
jgi:hypothetical protein